MYGGVPFPLLFFFVAFWLWQRDRLALAWTCVALGVLTTGGSVMHALGSP